MIGGFIINVPSLNEQKEIVRIIDNLLENEERARELFDVIEKIDLMKKAILARAFRGELENNNPEEESAVELLKEVLKERI
jgi:type I restriction enzyme, S subunit